ncbi:MAG: DUF1015 family protein [Candidatus Dormibacter sp.]|uniref:DUF1015 family protein n=1 Tax=Candidatus Dormibacter sp. TaxID=2973982 RepID=UPI00269BE3F6
MADVRPFRALRFSEPLGDVVAPPYDVLNEEQVRLWQARSPHNVTHLTRPGSDYEAAGRRLRQWLAEGVLQSEAEPALYIHETHFGDCRRTDLIGALRLEAFESGVVLPHELTHAGPKEDRLRLFEATEISLEPLWFLTEGLMRLLAAAPEGAVTEFDYADEHHILRRIAKASWLAEASCYLAGRQLLIADGHHRYETALLRSRELGDDPDASSRFTLALLSDLEDPGLVVLPTHRLLKAGVAVIGGEPVADLEQTLELLRGRVAAGTYRSGQFQLLPLEGEVAVVELHRQVIDNVLGKRNPEDFLAYTRDAEEAVRWVDGGEGVAAFFLDTPDVQAILRLARRAEMMPQKATYFFPKPPSGMLLMKSSPERNL